MQCIEIAEHADFFSFGTNDLTQMVCGISRDDAEQKFLADYLRPLMCNCSDPKAGQLTQRSSEVHVKDMAAGVGDDLGGQPGEQTAERLGAVALQSVEVLELPYDALNELPLAGRPTPVPLGSSAASGALRRRGHQSAVNLQPATLPRHGGEPGVGEVGVVTVGRQQRVADRPLVAVGRGQTEARDHALRIRHEGHLEAVDPLRFETLRPKAAWPVKSPLRQALTRTIAGTRVVSSIR